MPRFSVTILRTERITFEVDAPDLGTALDTYLGAGDEVGSQTTDITVEHSGQVSE